MCGGANSDPSGGLCCGNATWRCSVFITSYHQHGYALPGQPKHITYMLYKPLLSVNFGPRSRVRDGHWTRSNSSIASQQWSELFITLHITLPVAQNSRLSDVKYETTDVYATNQMSSSQEYKILGVCVFLISDHVSSTQRDNASPYDHVRTFTVCLARWRDLRMLCNKYQDAHGFSYSSAASNAVLCLLIFQKSAQSSNLLFIEMLFNGDGIVFQNSVASSWSN